MKLPQFAIDDLIKRAIAEDINYIDVTTDYLLDEDAQSTASFIAKDTGVLAGLDIALRVFTLLDDSTSFQVFKRDGDPVEKGDVIATIKGRTVTLLKGERTALNLLQHLSGIATATNRCVKLV